MALSTLAVRAAHAALEGLDQPSPALIELAEAAAADEGDHAFARIVSGFKLEPPEAALLLLLLAHAIDEAVAREVARLAPTAPAAGLPLWLAGRLVPGLTPAHLGAGGALRRFALVATEVGAVRVDALLRLADPLLDRLLGRPPYDVELAARFRPVPPGAGEPDATMRDDLVAAFQRRDAAGLSQVVIYEGADLASLGATLAAMGLRPFMLAAEALPVDPVQAERLAIDWSREAMLDGAALVVTADEASAGRAADIAARVLGHVVLVGPVRTAAVVRAAQAAVARPAEPDTLRARWAAALGPARAGRLGGQLARVAAHFALEPAEIAAACARAGQAIDRAPDERAAGARLWHAAARAADPGAVPGVTIVEPAVGWEDIVLPPATERSLRRLESHVRHATTVLDEWGFARRVGRGRGVTALLSGPSGTGKTMAAEVLAASLDLRMMLIDLSQIISKWVGETSKNIAACFRQAERSGAVMVWNEGDAIWGARGSVGSATDRHVNAEIGDLLQRMELFNGFSIVTTNLRHAVDQAFVRRFRFMIDFPMPSETERLRIWQKAFPPEAPLEPLDWSALAGLTLSGGSIRNIALGSAFHAAAGGGRIDAQAIGAELAEELRKQDLPVPVLAWGTRQ